METPSYPRRPGAAPKLRRFICEAPTCARGEPGGLTASADRVPATGGSFNRIGNIYCLDESVEPPLRVPTKCPRCYGPLREIAPTALDGTPCRRDR